jgi:hypothetical protein
VKEQWKSAIIEEREIELSQIWQSARRDNDGCGFRIGLDGCRGRAGQFYEANRPDFRHQMPDLS